MQAAIRGAARRISFETYIYESGEMGDAFTGVRDTARRGVHVNLVIDAVGGSGIDSDHVQRLRAGRLPHRPVQLRCGGLSLEEVKHRTHRTILVVDWPRSRSSAALGRRPLDRAMRRTRIIGATRWSRIVGPRGAAGRGRLLRELHRGRR